MSGDDIGILTSLRTNKKVIHFAITILCSFALRFSGLNLAARRRRRRR